jgi:hypothetical protein
MTTFYIRRGTTPARQTRQSMLGETFTIDGTPMECTRVKEAFLYGKHVACAEFQTIQQHALAYAGHAASDETSFSWTESSSDSLEADGWRPADPAAAIAFLHGK